MGLAPEQLQMMMEEMVQEGIREGIREYKRSEAAAERAHTKENISGKDSRGKSPNVQ